VYEEPWFSTILKKNKEQVPVVKVWSSLKQNVVLLTEKLLPDKKKASLLAT
jgi:hypothetical protein